MNELLNNKYLPMVVIGMGTLFFAIIMLVVIPAKIKKDVTRDVIQQLQRDYVPGPYTPGYDPDKVPIRLK